MIELKSLTKEFGSFTAVDALSFTVREGEVLGFLGPNGAGKSTTMKMVTGFMRPTSGTAVVQGHDVAREPIAVKRAVGYLPEGAPAYPDMTPESFLRFCAETRGYSGAERDRRVGATAERVNLAGVMRQPIDTLSKGYKRRVGLAQALLHDPRVLILDEPTDGLDPNQKHEVRELIRGLGREKVIVLSTHILEEVEAVCTRAVIISRGRIVADTTPGALQARARSHNAVRVRLRVVPEGLVGALRALEGVADVEALAPNDLRIVPADGRSLIAPVSDLLRARAVQSDELRVEVGRLDEVFRSLTAEAVPGKGAA